MKWKLNPIYLQPIQMRINGLKSSGLVTKQTFQRGLTTGAPGIDQPDLTGCKIRHRRTSIAQTKKLDRAQVTIQPVLLQ